MKTKPYLHTHSRRRPHSANVGLCVLISASLGLMPPVSAAEPSAAPAQQRQIGITVRLFERSGARDPAKPITMTADAIQMDANTKYGLQQQGGEDVLSAPKVVALENQMAKITIGNERQIAFNDEKRDVFLGVNLEVKSRIQPTGRIILSGEVCVRTQPPASADTAQPKSGGVWEIYQATQVPFILELAQGEVRRIAIGAAGLSAFEISASEVATENASVVYWQAFAALPKLDDAEKKALRQKEVLDEKAAAALCERLAPALGLLQKAAAIRHCDWQLDLSKGAELPLPHLSQARELAQGAVLRARWRMKRGDAGGALEDWKAALSLSRHVARAPLLISALVGVSVETMAIESLALHLGKFSAPQLESLRVHIVGLPLAPTAEECLRCEQSVFVPWTEAKIRSGIEAGQPQAKALGSLVAFAGTNVLPEDEPEAMEALGRLSLDDLFANLRRDYDTMISISRMPMAEAKIAERKFSDELASSHDLNRLLSRISIPALGKVRESLEAGLARIQLVLAALQVFITGEQSVQNSKDPYGAGAFGFEKTEQGFVLKSALEAKGKPVELRFGK